MAPLSVNSHATRREGYFDGRVVVITGAAAGIGRELAIALAKRGSLLALSDIDSPGLDETRNQCLAVGATTRADIVNVTDRFEVAAYADDLATQFKRIDLVINNAGVIFTGDINSSSFDDIEHVMNVDFWGIVHGTKAFLPYLIRSGGGQLINISSAYGLVAAPGYSAYNAAKFAVRGFTEAVQQEMHSAGHPVQVSCVYPGAVQTSIVRNGRYAVGENYAEVNEVFNKMARTSPTQAAAIILRGVQDHKRRIFVGPDAVAADLIARLSGTGYQRIFQLLRYVNLRKKDRASTRKET